MALCTVASSQRFEFERRPDSFVFKKRNCIRTLIHSAVSGDTRYNALYWRNITLCLTDPVNEIVALATHHTMNDKLRFLDLGGKLLANEATSVLRNACEHGLWLVIQNCHLIAEWLPQLLDIFHVRIYSLILITDWHSSVSVYHNVNYHYNHHHQITNDNRWIYKNMEYVLNYLYSRFLPK